MRVIFFYFSVLVFSCSSLFAEDCQINSTTSYDQTDPSAAIDAQGNSIIVWSSYRQDSNSGGIFAQRFDANNTPVGSEFQINSAALGNQTEPDVAMDHAGNFIVTWHCQGDDQEDIFARRFDYNSTPIGSQLRVNTNISGRQLYPCVAADPNGNFVIAWESEISPEPLEQRDVCFQLYDVAGAPVGAEKRANTRIQARYPDVGIDHFGTFTIAWMQNDSEHAYNLVMARMYNSDASPKTDPNIVSTTPFYTVTHPSISVASGGHFIIAWEAHPSAAAEKDIYARSYKWDGSPKCDEFIVNTYSPGVQQNPKVAINLYRDFLITWNSETTPGGIERDIRARRFDLSAYPVGEEFIVNTYTFSDQKYPDVIIRDNGKFTVVWQSLGQDGSGYGIFAASGPKIPFADFTGDLFVNFRDYCILASQWLQQGNPLTADLIADNKIDYKDLAVFSDQWLTKCYDCTIADLYYDGVINLTDFAMFAGDWLKQGPNLTGDIDRNGSVDFTDLQILLSHWLEACP